MKTGVEPRQLLALAQAPHRDAHRKTPFAQFWFEKLSIPLARKKDDRITPSRHGPSPASTRSAQARRSSTSIIFKVFS